VEGTEQRRLGVHFYADFPRWGEVAAWDPDEDPWRFGNTTESHAILELFVRLRQRGHLVTLGPKVPARSTGVAVLLGRLQESPGRVPVFAGRSIRHPVLIIRSGESRRPAFPLLLARLQVVPVVKRRSRRKRVMYPLPQRALIPRRPERRGRITVAAYKGYRSGVPEILGRVETSEAARRNGLEIRLDVPSEFTASDHRWEDFEDVDLVLCMRKDLRGDANETKPPTKLINAWAAGAIPVIDPQQSYLDIARPGIDAIVVRSDAELLSALHISQNPEVVRTLEVGVEEARMKFTTDRIVDQWERLLTELEELGQSKARLLLRTAAFVPLSIGALALSLHARLRARRKN